MNQKKPVVIFGDVHQLPDTSRLLKIGADEFPKLKILATGSSTVAATRKFRGSLTEVYQATQVFHLVRPFSGGGRREIVAQPLVFGFDTVFIAYARG